MKHLNLRNKKFIYCKEVILWQKQFQNKEICSAYKRWRRQRYECLRARLRKIRTQSRIRGVRRQTRLQRPCQRRDFQNGVFQRVQLRACWRHDFALVKMPRVRRSRCYEKAVDNLLDKGIENLIVIGGDGSFRGVEAMHEQTKLNVIGIPGTIDNDMGYTDSTIGFDTACNTVVDAILKLRDTITSHDRIMIWKLWAESAATLPLTARSQAARNTSSSPKCLPMWMKLRQP